MTELARLGFLLLGGYLALAPLSQFAWLVASDSETGIAGVLFAAGFWVMLSLVPGLALIWWAQSLSVRLFGSPDPSAQKLDSPSILAAGIAVIGVWLAVNGISILVGAVAGGVMTAGIAGLVGSWVGSAVRGTLLVVIGVLLTTKANSLSQFLFRTPSQPAA